MSRYTEHLSTVARVRRHDVTGAVHVQYEDGRVAILSGSAASELLAILERYIDDATRGGRP